MKRRKTEEEVDGGTMYKFEGGEKRRREAYVRRQVIRTKA